MEVKLCLEFAAFAIKAEFLATMLAIVTVNLNALLTLMYKK